MNGSENLIIKSYSASAQWFFSNPSGITGATPSRILGPALRGGGGAALEQNISIFNDVPKIKV